MIVARADPIRYGQLQKQIQSQFLLGQNQYADSMEKGTAIISNHKIYAKYYEIQKKNREQAKAAREEEQTRMTSFAQKEMDLPLLWKERPHQQCLQAAEHYPKKDWYFNKALQNYQEHETNDGDDMQSVQSTQSNNSHQHRRCVQRTNIARMQQMQAQSQSNLEHTAWNGYQGFQQVHRVQNRNDLTPNILFLQKQQKQLNELDNYNPKVVSKQTCGRYDYLKDMWMMDTGLAIPTTAANPNLVTNIRVSKQPLTMATNAGTKMLRYEADIEGFGTH